MLGDARQYDRYDRGPFARAMIAALRRVQREQNAKPSTFTPCRVGGCGLAKGHAERAGTDHQPLIAGDPEGSMRLQGGPR